MKIETLKFIIAATLLSGSAYALDVTPGVASTTNVAVPTTPAPVLSSETNPAPAPNQVVYTPRLPSVAELSNAAAAQGLTVDRMEQSSTRPTKSPRSTWTCPSFISGGWIISGNLDP